MPVATTYPGILYEEIPGVVRTIKFFHIDSIRITRLVLVGSASLPTSESDHMPGLRTHMEEES